MLAIVILVGVGIVVAAVLVVRGKAAAERTALGMIDGSIEWFERLHNKKEA